MHLALQCGKDTIQEHEIRKIMGKIEMYNSSRKIRNQKFVFLIVNIWITVTVPDLKVKVKISSLGAEEEKQTFFAYIFGSCGFLP